MRNKRRAQAMTEYVVVVGLIGVIGLGAVRAFGQTLEQTVRGRTQALSSARPAFPSLPSNQRSGGFGPAGRGRGFETANDDEEERRRRRNR